MVLESEAVDPLAGLKSALAKERAEKRAAVRRVRQLEQELGSRQEAAEQGVEVRDDS